MARAEDLKTTAIKRPTRLGDEVYNSVYAWLMSQKIQPGSRISIDNLARELGVSHTPVREALSRLEAQGLIVKTHLIGFSAAPQIDRTRFDQIYEMRLLLEPFATRKAAALIDPGQLITLQRLAAEMRGEGGREVASYSDFAHLDGEFHDIIAAACGNGVLRQSLASLHTHIHLFRLFPHTGATTKANAEHAEIINALEARDARAAERAMRNHVKRSYARFSTYFH
ncbi:GntR family transcriptional regulator [Devosia pacifica]|uniref:GntR family transcriptional regulator n=1 Tax=Devosia pacifica TaxID=1335967 RepID=A0A918S3K3_9HYPH|nr:GntR family transcriptional regulator [Devosia pacifica]GHA19019.1 GntR family transcriptional regulator [Devosia pacifica]